NEMTPDIRRVFRQIANWAGGKGQTAQRLRLAIGRLRAMDASVLRMDDFVKTTYILAQRWIDGNDQLRLSRYLYYDSAELTREILWSKLMPWERARAMRVLNALTNFGRNLFQTVNQVIANQGEKPYDPGRALGLVAWQTTGAPRLFNRPFLPANE